MLRKNQNGFAVIVGFLVLIGLGVIGFTGWYVYRDKQTTGRSLNAANYSSNKIADKETPTEKNFSRVPDDWLVYENKDWGISFKYPPSWGAVNFNVYSTGSIGDTLVGNFKNINSRDGEFMSFTDPWEKPIDVVPFGKFNLTPDGLADYYIRQQKAPDKFVAELKPTKVIKLSDGSPAVIFGGQELADWLVKIPQGEGSGGTPGDQSANRHAFINLESSYNGSSVRGFEFIFYKLSPQDINNFYLMVSTFKKY
jgi:hypothetical protein